MLDKRQAQDRLDREVRKLMPKKPRKRSRKAIQKRKQKNAERLLQAAALPAEGT
jgi:hypothetical protein